MPVNGRLAERRETSQEIFRLLDDLGSSPDTVAGTLARTGVQGHRYGLTDCPIARFTNAVLTADPRAGSVKVGLRRLRVGRALGVPLSVPLPAAVREFIVRFDDGWYPQLEITPVGGPIPFVSIGP
jgi:hypothetical protein